MGNIELGDSVLDAVTGFSGIATATAVYLYADPMILVEAPAKDGKLNSEWISERRLSRLVPKETSD
mgnify:CR=1 FL=1